MKSFIEWIKPTVTGTDGKASHRRLTVIYFIIILTYMVYKTAYGSVFPEIAWIVISGGAGLFSGLSVWQEIVNKRKDESKFGNYNNPNPPMDDYYGRDNTDGNSRQY